jgi:hypothetical protein
MSPFPPLLLAALLATPLFGVTNGGGSPIRLRVESAAQPAGSPSVLVIDGLRGLPRNGAVVEVRAHARGVDAQHALLTEFDVLSSKTASWRIAVSAPPSVLAAITADRNATVSLTAHRHDAGNRSVAISARSVTLLRSASG